MRTFTVVHNVMVAFVLHVQAGTTFQDDVASGQGSSHDLLYLETLMEHWDIGFFLFAGILTGTRYQATIFLTECVFHFSD